jgi:nitrate/nitrite transport system substrate-binding protein
MGDSSVSLTRRRFLQAGAALGGAMLMPGLMQAAWAAGSDKPELTTVRVGFIPLTDCAPLVIAALKGFDKKYGITLVPTKEASWAAVRDKLVSGELDAAHVLYGLLYGLELGIAGKTQSMANLMTLNQNGQGITLSSDLLDKGVTDGESLKKLIGQSAPEHTPLPIPSRPALTPCGSITGWRARASTPLPTFARWSCRRRKW